jgi:hypothetical protein
MADSNKKHQTLYLGCIWSLGADLRARSSKADFILVIILTPIRSSINDRVLHRRRS